MELLSLAADDSTGAAGAALGLVMVFYVIAYVVATLPLMGVFSKAGKPGWAAFVPIYNMVVLLEVVGRPIWWVVLYIIPVVNLVIAIIVSLDLAKSFGRDSGFAVGLILLNTIFMFILWLGPARYVGPAASLRPALPAA